MLYLIHGLTYGGCGEPALLFTGRPEIDGMIAEGVIRHLTGDALKLRPGQMLQCEACWQVVSPCNLTPEYLILTDLWLEAVHRARIGVHKFWRPAPC